jgi:alpha-L-arabinofuranosidase
VLAEQPYPVAGDGSWERIAFELTPDRGTARGSFGLSLKSRGEVELGFVFLQAGAWGRVKGLPVRREFVEALKRQGISVIRYNGSMVDVGADTYLYRWKKMIGPVDERRVCFRSGFNPYATHSFGLIEALQVAEAIEAQAMVGLSMDETYEDIRDFVEYVNGPVTSNWGALRARHGHPAPYHLKHIQVDNERRINRGYVECMKKFARAAWDADPEMRIVASLNIGPKSESYARGTPEYALATELFGWFVAHGKSDRMVWDPHYSGAVEFADSPGYRVAMGITLQAELARDYPGHKLTLCPMEENGQRCDWNRGLAHAHNWNSHQRHSLIADNRIEDFVGPAMLLCDRQDAMVRDNRIVLSSPLARQGVKPEALILRNTADVIEENNSVVATPP